MKNPDHISKRLETIFGVKILKFYDVDPGGKNSDPESGMEKNSDPEWTKFGSRIRDKHPGSATLKKSFQIRVTRSGMNLKMYNLKNLFF